MAHSLDSWRVYVDGTWREGKGGPDRDVVNPESFQGFPVGYRQSGVGGDDGSHGLEPRPNEEAVRVDCLDGPTAGPMPYSGR